ncbi:hypothetical protein ELAN_08900 [Elizabethkingia anophelis]|nr:hypothetical protein ELAN_08900 [Elizabethkingia anophelis]
MHLINSSNTYSLDYNIIFYFYLIWIIYHYIKNYYYIYSLTKLNNINMKKIQKSDLRKINGGQACYMAFCPQCNNNDGPYYACIPIGARPYEVCCPNG